MYDLKIERCMYGGDVLAIRACAECGGPLCISCGIYETQMYYCLACYPAAFSKKKNGISRKIPFGK